MIFPTIINVSQEHISNGTKKNPTSCPIALAFHSKFGEECEPSITETEFEVFIEEERILYGGRVSEELAKDIMSFDKKGEMKPTSLKMARENYPYITLEKVEAKEEMEPTSLFEFLIKGKIYIGSIQEELSEDIKAFDNGEGMEPTNIVIETDLNRNKIILKKSGIGE